MTRKANAVTNLDGRWTVERSGGLLPPMVGVSKEIAGARGHTVAGPLRLPFDVRGHELRYRGLLIGLVDVLERDGDGFSGRATYRGRTLGRFRMRRAAT
jgi:hypothetical protein